MGMTTEELTLYRGLQPLFREKMGAWRLGDMYWCPRLGEYGDNHYKVIIPDIDEDLRRTSETTPCCPDVAIRIPDVYSRDPEKPERGLWGMVDWDRFDCHIQAGKVYLYETVRFNKEIWDSGWCTLPLALLMALKWEVENGHR